MKPIRWIFLSLLILGTAFAVWWMKFPHGEKNGDGAKEAGAKHGVAVVVGKVTEQDMPVWLTGIGTVQASNTVTVRPRVGGSLDQVNFTEGATVKQGEVLARIDPRPYQSVLSQAIARKAQDEAQLANAKLELNRFAQLLKDDAVSRQQLDLSQATVTRLEALALADQAAIEAAQLDLDFTTVRAPISGRTGVRLVDAGNIVTANQGTGLVVVTQLQPISVVFTLPQQNLAAVSSRIRPGEPPLVVQAEGEDGILLDEGKLELIDNQIDVSTGTLRLKATFNNEKLTLWPGQFVTGRVLVETRKKAVVVASEAVQPGLDGPFCYRVKDDQTVEARPVKTGLTIEGQTIIEQGLANGDRVVREGQAKLKPGMRIEAKEVFP